MNINLSSILKRIGMGATVAAGVVATQAQATGQLPHTLSALIPALVIGTLSAFPAGSAPAGLLTPKAPGQPSVADQVIGGFQALITAPADQRKAEMEQIATNVTMSILTSNLAGKPASPSQLNNPTNDSGASAAGTGGNADAS